MTTQRETLIFTKWFDAWAPSDRRTIVDVAMLIDDPHPVLWLQRLRQSERADARVLLVRDTFWGAWLRGTGTLSRRTCRAVLEAAGYEIIAYDYTTPLYEHKGRLGWLNGFMGRIPGLRLLCHYELCVARALPGARDVHQTPSVSIIMPCRNEAGTVEQAIRRMPHLGSYTEMICIEGHSRDTTLEELYRLQTIITHLEVKVLVQTGRGKKNAVVEACDHARGDIIIIFDSDMTVLPEDMEAFYRALVNQQGDVINGSRLMFRLPSGAMRGPNFVANHAFAGLISYGGLLGQKVTDTLCGTKVCWRRDYELSRIQHAWLWNADPFGDFAWLFGIAMLGGKVHNLPVRYYARRYGAPLRGCFGYGVQLLKLLWRIFVIRCVRNC